MADLPISGLPAIVGLATNTDPFPLIQGGVTSKATMTQIPIGAAQIIGMTNGQIPIGSTGLGAVSTTISAGIGISVTNGAGSINIAASGGGVTWNTVTAATQTMAANQGYIANYGGGALVFTLPATSTVGDIYFITGINAAGWMIAQNAGQTIHLGPQDTTTGVTGSVSSTEFHECIHLVCVIANTDFTMISCTGNPSIT